MVWNEQSLQQERPACTTVIIPNFYIGSQPTTNGNISSDANPVVNSSNG